MKKRRTTLGAGLAVFALAAATLAQPASAVPDDQQDDSLTRAEVAKARNAATQPARPQRAAGVMVKLSAGADRAGVRAAAARALEGEAASTTVVSRTIRAYDASQALSVADARAAAAELADQPGVEWARPNFIRHAAAAWPVPVNDTDAGKLHNVWDTRSSAELPYSVTPWVDGGYSTKAPSLWRKTKGQGVVVAVLDTGIRANHPELAPQLVPGYDTISSSDNANDGDGRDADPSDPGDWGDVTDCGGGWDQPWDSSWHGTHVAGTIAAVADNNQGVVGVAPGAKIQPVRVLGRCGGTDADIATGMLWASGEPVPGLPVNAHPAQIINLSLGGDSSCDSGFQEVFDRVRARGTHVFVALGNEDEPSDYKFPANCAGAIGVVSTSPLGDRAGYSNYGTHADISAPGGDHTMGVPDALIYSTVDTGTRAPVGPGYDYMQGTSMATPAAAGVGALLHTLGQWNPSTFEAAIKAAVSPFQDPYGWAWDCDTTTCGTGIVDASKIPAPLAAPSISGTAAVGSTLTAVDAAWTGPAVTHRFTWYVAGAQAGTGTSFVVPASAAGQPVTVRTSVASGPFAPIGATSVPVIVGGTPVPPPTPTPPPSPDPNPIVKKRAKISVKVARKVKHNARARIQVRVRVRGIARPRGTLTIRLGRKVIKRVRLRPAQRGVAVVRTARLKKRGKQVVRVSYSGTRKIRRASARTTFRVV